MAALKFCTRSITVFGDNIKAYCTRHRWHSFPTSIPFIYMIKISKFHNWNLTYTHNQYICMIYGHNSPKYYKLRNEKPKLWRNWKQLCEIKRFCNDTPHTHCGLMKYLCIHKEIRITKYENCTRSWFSICFFSILYFTFHVVFSSSSCFVSIFSRHM